MYFMLTSHSFLTENVKKNKIYKAKQTQTKNVCALNLTRQLTLNKHKEK